MSSSGSPGACMTPSRDRNSITRSILICSTLLPFTPPDPRASLPGGSCSWRLIRRRANLWHRIESTDTMAKVGAPADPAAVEFESRVDATLQLCCELAQALIGAQQAAMSLIVEGDWLRARKYFSLSEKHAAWRDFTMPGRGIGLHALVVDENRALRLAQTEVESHPDWRGFAEAARHTPAGSRAARGSDRRRGRPELRPPAGFRPGRRDRLRRADPRARSTDGVRPHRKRLGAIRSRRPTVDGGRYPELPTRAG